MSTPECVITGCALVKDDGRAWAWGDLHRLADCFIFNAVLEDGQAKWHYTPFPDDGRKAMVMQSEAQYFERRGVIVFHRSQCTPNMAAAVYAAGRLA